MILEKKIPKKGLLPFTTYSAGHLLFLFSNKFSEKNS
jgi:hypothetical protein